MDVEYRCLDSAGKEVKGVVASEGLSEAKSLLKGRGLTVLDIEEKQTQKGKRSFSRKRISDSDIYNMARELSILLKSGIKLDKAFGILINSVSNERLREKLTGILKDVKAGKAVSQAFSDSGAFNFLTTAMLSAGESSGDFRSAFENIAKHTSFQIRFKSEIRNATAYPVFLIFASLVTLLVIFKFIVPKFFSIFGQGQVSLPLPARMLYSVAEILNSANIYFIVIFLVFLVVILRLINLRDVFSRLYSYTVYIPVFRNLILYLELSRFSYSMYSMLNSGIEFIKALKLSSGVIQHRDIREAIEPTVNQVKEGKGIADAFSQVRFLPELVPNMLRVGEGSGNLKEIFLELHEVFDERFRNSVKRLLVLVEPVIITVTGIIVGFIVISLILTVMSVGNIKV